MIFLSSNLDAKLKNKQKTKLHLLETMTLGLCFARIIALILGAQRESRECNPATFLPLQHCPQWGGVGISKASVAPPVPEL